MVRELQKNFKVLIQTRVSHVIVVMKSKFSISVKGQTQIYVIKSSHSTKNAYKIRLGCLRAKPFELMKIVQILITFLVKKLPLFAILIHLKVFLKP